MGLRFVEAAEDRFVAELAIDERHGQTYGLLHGAFCRPPWDLGPSKHSELTPSPTAGINLNSL
jgi:hypothetical protein